MENIQFHRPTFKQKNNSYLPYCCLCQRNTRLKNSESQPKKTDKKLSLKNRSMDAKEANQWLTQ